jgi:hypothetical protein
MKRSVPLALLLALIAAVPATAGQAGPVTIAFQAASPTPSQTAGHMAGTFAMSGRFADTGIVTTSYGFAGSSVGATATLTGTRGIFTIALTGRVGRVVDGRQTAGGRWRLCGGTGAYRHAAGSGLWEHVADFGVAPRGMSPPAMHGAFYGRLARGTVRRPPGSLGVRCG